MTPYNDDLMQSLKWLENNAVNLQAIIQAKSDWYQKQNKTFWVDWKKNVFDIDTCREFGIVVWCIILGVPVGIFQLDVIKTAWAYGKNRQNYGHGNFIGGDNVLLSVEEARLALKLRYAALTSNGRTAQINQMLNLVFNKGDPWNKPAGNYVYLADSTYMGSKKIAKPNVMEYRIGSSFNLSGQLMLLLNDPSYGIMPSVAGTAYIVNKE